MKRYITCMTIAGSDPSGGAGIEADLKTFSALGTYGTAVITAITAQNTVGVRKSFAIPAGLVASQAAAVFDDLMPQFVKIGMTVNCEIVSAIAKVLKQYAPKIIVLDPVMVSTSGHKLIDDDAIEAVKLELIPMATIITPNLPECAALTGRKQPESMEDVKDCGTQLLRENCKSVLIKGGHFENSTSATDVFMTKGVCESFVLPRVITNNTHGTGCTLSSAITAFLARGYAMPEAVAAAKNYLHQALMQGADVKVGEGHGPVNHFFNPEKQLFE